MVSEVLCYEVLAGSAMWPADKANGSALDSWDATVGKSFLSDVDAFIPIQRASVMTEETFPNKVREVWHLLGYLGGLFIKTNSSYLSHFVHLSKVTGSPH